MRKILVIDDTELNRALAVRQFSDDIVAVAASYEEGECFLDGTFRIETGTSEYHTRTENHPFDVVLVDLMMPYGLKQLGREEKTKYQGQLAPVGIFLALMAAQKGRADVLLLTDLNHHHHPASACLDPFKSMMVVGESRLLLTNYGFIRDFEPGHLDTPLDPLHKSTTAVRGKSWKATYERFFGPR